MRFLSLVGVEDGGFAAFKQGQTTLLCAVKMVGDRVEAVRLGFVTVDGVDATDVLLGLLVNIRCDAVILGGVSFAGFNVIDATRVGRELGVPVIVYSGEEPDSASVLAALKAHFPDWERRWKPIEGLGDVYNAVTKRGSPQVFFEVVGESREWAEGFLRESATLSRIPEPVRVAGLIARGLTRSA